MDGQAVMTRIGAPLSGLEQDPGLAFLAAQKLFDQVDLSGGITISGVEGTNVEREDGISEIPAYPSNIEDFEGFEDGPDCPQARKTRA